MKKFDFHTHAYPEAIADWLTGHMAPKSPAGRRYGTGTLTELLERNANRGIQACVELNIAASPAGVQRMNDFAIKNNQYEGIYAFGALHPQFDKIGEELRRLKDEGIKGIKLHPSAQKFAMDDKRALMLYEQIAKYDMIVLFHCGRDPQDEGIDYASPAVAARVLTYFPEMKAVLAHLGGMDELTEAREFLWGKKVYLDLAMTAGYAPEKGILDFLRIHPTEYILYGSDYPWHDEEELDMLEHAELTDVQKKNILWDNAAALLGIKE